MTVLLKNCMYNTVHNEAGCTYIQEGDDILYEGNCTSVVLTLFNKSVFVKGIYSKSDRIIASAISSPSTKSQRRLVLISYIK